MELSVKKQDRYVLKRQKNFGLDIVIFWSFYPLMEILLVADQKVHAIDKI